MKKWLLIFALFLIIGSLIYIQFNTRTDADTLTIGVVLPFSGDTAVFGEKARKGIEVALQDMQDVHVIYEDTHDLTPKNALTASTKLVTVDKVDILFGPLGPEATLAVAPLTHKNNILHFAYSLCSPQFTQYKNLFCIYPGVQEQLSQLPAFLKTHNVKTLALITEQSDYGNDTYTFITTHASSSTYSIILEEKLTQGTKDMRTLATKIISTKPDAVLVASQDVLQNFLLVQQLHERGYTGLRIAYTDTDPSYVEQFKNSVEGMIVPGAIGNTFSEQYMKAYIEKYNEKPDLYSALAYDVIRYIYGSWKENGKTLSNLGHAITKHSYESPAINSYEFSKERTVSFPTEIWVVEEGEYMKIE